MISTKGYVCSYLDAAIVNRLAISCFKATDTLCLLANAWTSKADDFEYVANTSNLFFNANINNTLKRDVVSGSVLVQLYKCWVKHGVMPRASLLDNKMAQRA